MRSLRQWFGNRTSRSSRTTSFRPRLEALESREVPTLTTITSNFNGTAIPAGASVWFNSVGKVSGLGADPVTIRLTQATITSPNFTVAVPDSVITISSAITTASTAYDAATNTWVTMIPRTGFSGNIFLAGATLPAPSGLPGGIKPVTWQADFSTDTPGVNINWTWAAAVYTTFSPDYNALGVKPVDGSAVNPYANSHHAGTPENFTSFVFGGARGGGGSNFTGSYSATKSVKPEVIETPAESSLSGFVFEDDSNEGTFDANEVGIANVLITLQGMDDLGNAVLLTTTTDQDGYYIFANLRPGNYSLQESQPQGFDSGIDTIGTQGGIANSAADLLYNIVLAAGVDGQNNNFGELLTPPQQ